MYQKVYDEANKQWGILEVKQAYARKISVGQMILDSISSHGSKVAQINHDTGTQVTFHELWLKSICAAQNLQKRGYKPGQVFTFMVYRSDYLVPIVLASLCLACPINTLHPMLSKEEIIRVLTKTEPSVVFCDVKLYNQIDEVLKILKLNVEIFTFDGQFDESEPVENLLAETTAEDYFSPICVDLENDIGAILCSSGSTGPSKCVSLSYSTLIPRSDEIWMIEEDDVGLCFDSIYWTAGLRFMLRCAQFGALNIISKNSFSSDLQLDLIQKYRVTVLAGIPLNLLTCMKNERIHKMDLSCLKTITFYGSKTPAYLVQEFNRYFPNAKFLSRYGMAEVGRICDRFLDVNDCEHVGRLVKGCIAKIIDDDGNRCGPNVKGEIYVKKSYKFFGYFKDAKATASAIDSEGFFQTGDIGHFDENGNLSINYRKRFILNVFYFEGVLLPTEMEAYLIALEDIEEVCIVGIPILDNYEIPAAVIVRNKDSALSQQNVYDTVADHFSEPTKLRGGVYFVDALPKTHNGKLNRTKIRALAENMFHKASKTDPEVQSFLSDYPDDYQKLIQMFVPDSIYA